MAYLNFDITGNSSSLIAALEQSKRALGDVTSSLENNGAQIEAMFKKLSMAAASVGIGMGFQELVSKVANVRSEFQKLEISFNTMLGSKEKADALMNQLIKTAQITPFDMKDVAGGAKQLLAYGTQAEEVNETLTRLGDIAAGLSLPMGDLVMLYGTTMTQGRVFTQDLRQFMGRGIPLADELAKQFGVSKNKVGELVTAGKVGAEEFKKAIWSMSDAGGQFGGLMENQSKSIGGQMANIGDAVEQMFNDIGKSTEGVFSTTLSVVGTLVENWKWVGAGVLGVLSAFGLYKAEQIAIRYNEKKAAEEAVEAENAKAAAREAALAPLQAEIDAIKKVAEEERKAAEEANVRANTSDPVFEQYKKGNLSAEEALNIQATLDEPKEKEAAEKAILAAEQIKQAEAEVAAAREAAIAPLQAKIDKIKEEMAAEQEAAEMKAFRESTDDDILEQVDAGNLSKDEAREMQRVRDEYAAAEASKASAQAAEQEAAAREKAAAPLQAELQQLQAIEDKEREIQAQKKLQQDLDKDIYDNLQAGNITKDEAYQLQQLRANQQARIDSQREEIAQNEKKIAQAKQELQLKQEIAAQANKTVSDAEYDNLRAQSEFNAAKLEVEHRRNNTGFHGADSFESMSDEEFAQEYQRLSSEQEAAAQKLLSAREAQAAAAQDVALSEQNIIDLTQQQEQAKANLVEHSATAVANTSEEKDKASELLQTYNEIAESKEDDNDESGSAVDSIQELIAANEEEAESSENAAIAADNASQSIAQSASAKNAEATATKANSAATQANSTAENANTAAKNTNTASSRLSTAATNAESVSENANAAAKGNSTKATWLSIAAHKAGAAATTLCKAAVDSLKNSFNAMKTAMMTNPFTAIITGVSTIIAMIPMIKEFFGGASEGEEKLAENLKQIDEEASKSRSTVERNYAIMEACVKNNATETKLYKDAVSELLAVSKEHGINLDNENNQYAALIENKQKIIELIAQETEAKRLKAQNDAIWQEYEDTRTKEKEKLEDYGIRGESDNKELYAEVILTAIENRNDEIKRLEEEARQKILEANKLFGDSNYKAKQQLYAEAGAIRVKITQMLTESAQQMAHQMGENITFDTRAIESAFSTLVFKSEITSKKMESFNNGLANTQATINNMQMPEAPTDWENLDTETLGTKLKDLLAASKETTDSLTTLGETKAKPTVDSSDIDKTKESADNATSAVDNDLNNSSATPQTDDTNIWGTQNAAISAKDAVYALGAASATPYINTVWIDNFINKLLDGISLFKTIGGEVGALPNLQAQRYNTLNQKRQNGKLTQQELQELNKLEVQGRNNTRTTIGGKEFQFTNPKDIAFFMAIKNTPGYRNDKGHIDVKNMPKDVRETYMGMIRNVESAKRRRDMNSSQSQWDKAMKSLSTRAKKGRSGGMSESEIAEHNKTIKELMADPNLKTGDKRYKQLQAQLIDPSKSKGSSKKGGSKSPKKSNSKKGGNKAQSVEDKKQQEFEIKQMEADEARRKEEAIKEIDFATKKFEIEKMPDGYRKERESALLESSKSRYELEQKVLKEAERIEEAEMKAWLKEKKGRKEYQWYELDAKTTGRRTAEEYTAEAKNVTGYDIESEKIQYNESKALKKAAEELEKSQNEYLSQYGDFAQKRQAIKEKYEVEIKTASDGGDIFSVFALQEEMQTKLKEIDDAERKLTADWSMIFGDLQNLSISQLTQARNTLQEYMKAGDLSVEDYKTAVSQINNINAQIAQSESEIQSLFGLSTPYFEERKRLTLEAEQAQKLYNEARQRQIEIEGELNSSKLNVSTALDKAGISVSYKDVDVAKSQNYLDRVANKYGVDSKEYKEVEQALKGLADSSVKASNAQEKTTQATTNYQTAQSKLSNFVNSLSKKFEAASQIMSKITANLNELPGLLSQFGVDEDSDAGKAIAAIADGANQAMGALTDFSSGNYIGALSKAVGAIKSIGSIFGFGSGNAEKVRKLTEKLTEANERLVNSIDTLKNEITEARGGIKLLTKAEEARDMQQRQIDNQKQILEAQMSYTAAHHSNAYYWDDKFDAKNYSKINKWLAQYLKDNPNAKTNVNSVGSLNGILQLTPEQLAYIRAHDPELWKTIINTGKYDKSEYWEAYADLAGLMDELNNQINEALTQVSFDSLRDSFLSTLMDMDADSEDFADAFSQYMMKAVLNAKLSDTLDGQLKDFYAKWVELANDEDGLTAQDIAILKGIYESIVDEGMQVRDEVAEITGYKESQHRQEGSSRGFAGMSQDTAEELNGRFTALCEIEAKHLELAYSDSERFTQTLAAQLGNLASIASSEQQRNMLVSEIRDMMFISTDKLSDIADNTKIIKSVNDKLDDVVTAIKNI